VPAAGRQRLPNSAQRRAAPIGQPLAVKAGPWLGSLTPVALPEHDELAGEGIAQWPDRQMRVLA
jgi:hypothetical protein